MERRTTVSGTLGAFVVRYKDNYLRVGSGMTDAQRKEFWDDGIISDARVSTGANGKGTRITISDGEWEAIQAGAISDTTLKEILRYADPDVVRARATPRASTQLSDARVNRIKAMANSGSTNSEIADALGISPSTVSKYLNE